MWSVGVMYGPMAVTSIVVNASPVRYSEYTFDATCDAANDPADSTANGASDRTCRTIALLGPFLCAPNDPPEAALPRARILPLLATMTKSNSEHASFLT